MTTSMEYEIIDTSSVYVPLGYLFIAVEKRGIDESLFISKCLEKDDFSISAEEVNEIEIEEMLENIECLLDDLERSKMKSNIISKIKNIVTVGNLPHKLESWGGSFFIVCEENIFYINWQRES